MNRSGRQLTPRNLKSPVKTINGGKLGTITSAKDRNYRGSAQRSILSQSFVKTSDAEQSFAALIRKALIFIHVLIILISLALIAIATWMLIPNSHRMVILKVQKNPIFIIFIYSCLGGGLFFLFFSILGIFVASKVENEKLLALHAVICSVLALITVFLGIGAMSYASQMSLLLNVQLKRTLEKNYLGEESKSDVSLAWNTVQIKLECCGINGYSDWLKSKWYLSDNTNINVFGLPDEVRKQWPETCCQLSEETSNLFMESEIFEPTVIEQKTCYETHPEPVNVNTKGCGEEIDMILATICYITATLSLAIFFFLFFIIICIFGILKDYSHEVIKNPVTE